MSKKSRRLTPTLNPSGRVRRRHVRDSVARRGQRDLRCVLAATLALTMALGLVFFVWLR